MKIVITRAEWRWTIIASVLILALSTIPYAAGVWSETADLRFGGAVFDRQDYNAHVATIQIGLRGDWLPVLLHTSESTTPVLLKSFYIAVGQLGRLLPVSPPLLFQSVRWVGGFWMLLTLYAFTARFLSAVALRRAAFLFGALGSGIGWLMMLFQWQPNPNVSPIDFWLIDLYGFFSLLTLPHLPIVMALQWTATLAMLQYWETGRARWLGVGALCLAATQWIQPFAPFVVDATITVFALWRSLAQRVYFPWRSLMVLAVAQFPLAMYTLTVLYRDPLWSIFSRQNITLSPTPDYYFFGLGILGLLAALGGWRVARRSFGPAHLLIIWIAVVAILVYVPVLFQRRFTEGITAPLAVLAAIGLGYTVLPTLGRWRAAIRAHYPYRRAREMVLVLAIVMTTFSTLYLVFGGALLTRIHDPRLFDSAAVVEAVDWLGNNSDWRDTVFASERTGSFIPAQIGHRVYLGHEMETLKYSQKQITVARFYDAMGDAERLAILRDCGCRFIFWGPDERILGSFQPDGATFLERVFANANARVYAIKANP